MRSSPARPCHTGGPIPGQLIHGVSCSREPGFASAKSTGRRGSTIDRHPRAPFTHVCHGNLCKTATKSVKTTYHRHISTQTGVYTPTMEPSATIALTRFALGRRPANPPPDNPGAWLRAQLHHSAPTNIGAATIEAATAVRTDRENKTPNPASLARALYQSKGAAAIANAVATAEPFRERLVWFWSNHFTVSIRRGIVNAFAGAFVEDAIRPHVTGTFQDMLLAVMRHPAMLLYLDNAASAGPNSPRVSAATNPAGARRGLNENLARECLELHTVTPASGYTQADVTSFARILTGWSVDLREPPLGFRYRPGVHEPGVHRVLNRDFPDGENGGIEALRFLASHPSTHRNLAKKLAGHFVSDIPPPAAVRKIEAVLRDTGGDLGAAAAALTQLPEAWVHGGKFRTPLELTVASFRALDVPADPPPAFLGILSGLGQPLWNAPAPDGWSDAAATWTSPEFMMRRIDWAYGFAARIGERDPRAIAGAVLGSLLRPETGDAIARAESRRDAITLLLTSPEFQRR